MRLLSQSLLLRSWLVVVDRTELAVHRWPEVVTSGPDATDTELDDDDGAEAANDCREERVDDVFGNFNLVEGSKATDDPDRSCCEGCQGAAVINIGEGWADHVADCIGHKASDNDDDDGNDELRNEGDHAVERNTHCIVSAECTERELQDYKADEVVDDLSDESAAVCESCPLKRRPDACLVDVAVEVDLAK